MRRRQMRLSRLFDRTERYLRCGNVRRFKDTIQREPALLAHSEESCNLLLLAAWRKQHALVAWLLEHGADPDLTSPDNDQTLLITAACENDVLLARLALDAGADIEKPNNEQETPLGYACCWNAIEVVQILCERGADVNGTEGGKGSYLWNTQAAKQTEVEQILVSFGAKAIAPETSACREESCPRTP